MEPSPTAPAEDETLDLLERLATIEDVIATTGRAVRREAGPRGQTIASANAARLRALARRLRSLTPPTAPSEHDSGTFGELPSSIRGLYARVTGADGGHVWDNMTRDEQRAWLIRYLDHELVSSPTPPVPEATRETTS